MTRALMFQGTGSDVGKSLIVAGLCRAFARRGLRVIPFKPQNMSNNAAVTNDGGEIGRAQWLQAFAAGVEPSVHMNPVLLKPQSDQTSQVIVQGKYHATSNAADYQKTRGGLMTRIMQSYAHVRGAADLVLVEGAGSPAEINLRAHDIANMGFAREADCPVVLIGDIDRGGVIASMVGTKNVIAPEDAAMIRGFIINKFRGDIALFADGMAAIEAHTGWRGLGVVRHHAPLRHLPQEDALAMSGHTTQAGAGGPVRIVAFALPHLANFDDLDPLMQEPKVSFRWLKGGEVLPADTDLVIIPGSKATLSDLSYLREQGWEVDLQAHRRRGGRIMGLCGGYQMLGNSISDAEGREGPPATAKGLSMLAVDTVFAKEKTVTPWRGKTGEGYSVSGYEIHLGRTTGDDTVRPMFTGENGAEGAISADGLVCGSYIHGLFANDEYRKELLRILGAGEAGLANYWAEMDAIMNGWADALEASLDMDALLTL
ncbi:MAG: cobyric acid synthase [Alphaproteobacteria bacterium]|nr:cobyric acid synthase [Alphaproteobacteria bacterium]